MASVYREESLTAERAWHAFHIIKMCLAELAERPENCDVLLCASRELELYVQATALFGDKVAQVLKRARRDPRYGYPRDLEEIYMICSEILEIVPRELSAKGQKAALSIKRNLELIERMALDA